MKRIVLWLLSTASVVVLLFGYHTSTAGSMAAGVPSSYVVPPSGAPTTSGGTDPGTSTRKKNSKKSTQPSQSPSTTAPSTRTVAGGTAQTVWGPVQVQLTVSGSSITKVDVLQYPHGNSRDYQINSYALPILVKETVSAQSAQIDMVSGATYTSTGYVQSLQSALDKAGL